MPPVPARRRPLVGVPDGQSQHSVVDLAKDATLRLTVGLPPINVLAAGLGARLPAELAYAHRAVQLGQSCGVGLADLWSVRGEPTPCANR
jgi:hypothetical protein